MPTACRSGSPPPRPLTQRHAQLTLDRPYTVNRTTSLSPSAGITSADVAFVASSSIGHTPQRFGLREQPAEKGFHQQECARSSLFRSFGYSTIVAQSPLASAGGSTNYPPNAHLTGDRLADTDQGLPRPPRAHPSRWGCHRASTCGQRPHTGRIAPRPSEGYFHH